MFPFIYDQSRSAMISMLERAASTLFVPPSSSLPNPTQTQPGPLPNASQVQASQINSSANRLPYERADNRNQLNSFLNDGIGNLTATRPPSTNIQSSKAPISKEAMLDMTSEELRCLAEKNSMAGINKEQMDKLIAFHETQQHALAMMALEIRVSVSAIEATWGKRIAVRMATAWNRFLQSDEAKTLFKINDGVANGQAMSELSRMWKHMSPEAKEAFKAPLPDVELDFGDKVVSNKRARQIVQPRTILKATPTSLQTSGQQVESFLTNIIGQHLAAHNFQHRVATPGAQLAVELITHNAGSEEFAAQLQGYITGNSTEALEAKRHCKGIEGNAKSVKKEVFRRLGRLVCEKSNTALSNWPWSDCDSALAAFGLRVALRPGSKLNIDVLKTPSARLSGPDSRLINYELNQGGISLIPIDPANTIIPANRSNDDIQS
ncbi:hypothetical protein DFH28DRAFT_1187498 [Melampsora americana]|nr:hypothetical protein DFH28DRAFT_1187498 [Melampsora americana]